MQACIDLGSNSFHLLIGQWRDGGIEIVERYSEKVQLGEGVAATGSIGQAAYERGLSCLRGFKELMDQYPLQNYWALGTNTFRVAANAPDFIADASRLGIDVSIISGVQEAVLIYAGVITALPETEVNRVVLDIGGGSTEVIVGSGQRRLLTESLQIGSVAWRDRFFASANATAAELEAAMAAGRDSAVDVFAKIAPGVARAGWQEAFASSGTVKMLAAICECAGYGLRQIPRQALYDLQSELAACIADNTPLPGLKEKRRDLLLPGWCVLLGLMEAYQIELLHFSATALREGMLDFMVKNEKTLIALQDGELPAISSAGG